jgi:hypothetical protein
MGSGKSVPGDRGSRVNMDDYEMPPEKYRAPRGPVPPMKIPSEKEKREAFLARFMRSTPPAFDPPVDKAKKSKANGKVKVK